MQNRNVSQCAVRGEDEKPCRVLQTNRHLPPRSEQLRRRGRGDETMRLLGPKTKFTTDGQTDASQLQNKIARVSTVPQRRAGIAEECRLGRSEGLGRVERWRSNGNPLLVAEGPARMVPGVLQDPRSRNLHIYSSLSCSRPANLDEQRQSSCFPLAPVTG